MLKGILNIFPSSEYLRLSDLFAEETNKNYQNKDLCPTKRNLLLTRRRNTHISIIHLFFALLPVMCVHLYLVLPVFILSFTK